jgi:hypothetical protein
MENTEQNKEGVGMSTQEGGVVAEVKPSKKKKPKVHIATFRGIPMKLHQSLKDIAADLGISPGELARYLLENGLDQIAAGEEEVAPSFVPGGYTLYPQEKQNTVARTRRKRPKKSQQPRSYYGVPREVVEAVLEQSQALGVTQGELARYLFERGIARIESGELVLEPVPVQQIATLYPDDLGKA